MTPPYILTRSARRDLQDILEHIAADDPGGAARVLDKFEETFEILSRMPRLGHSVSDLGDSVRLWTVYTYLVLYRSECTPLEVLRIVSGHRDLERMPLLDS